MASKQSIYSLETLFKIASDLKKRGKRICLTHGAFDLFHFAHLDLIQKSAAMCDYLIVGVDSDQSVQSYKSNKRPIIDQESRVKIVNELNCVNAVFLKHIDLGDDTLIRLYRYLMTDIVTIGINYAIEERTKKITSKTGTQLIKIETDQRYSTTSIVNKIASEHTPKI